LGINQASSRRPRQTFPRKEEAGRFRPEFPRIGIGALIFRNDSFLLVKRGNPPRKGMWTPPGGLIHLGEDIESALHRELAEECHIRARFDATPEVFEFILKNGACIDYHYIVLDYIGSYLDGEVKAGDDVDEASWFTLADLERLDTTDEVRRLVHTGLMRRKSR